MRVIHLLRKPLATTTIAQSLVRYGTGALHLDVVRIQGRWPPNLILEHRPGCELVGTKFVATSGWRDTDASSSHIWKGRNQFTGSHCGNGGVEEVEDWHCVEGCPLRELGGGGHFYFQFGGRR